MEFLAPNDRRELLRLSVPSLILAIGKLSFLGEGFSLNAVNPDGEATGDFRIKLEDGEIRTPPFCDCRFSSSGSTRRSARLWLKLLCRVFLNPMSGLDAEAGSGPAKRALAAIQVGDALPARARELTGLTLRLRGLGPTSGSRSRSRSSSSSSWFELPDFFILRP